MSNHTEPPRVMQWILFSSHCCLSAAIFFEKKKRRRLAKLENILQESANNKRKMFSRARARRLPSITKRRCMIRNFLTTWMSSSSLLSLLPIYFPPHERMSHEKWHHQATENELPAGKCAELEFSPNAFPKSHIFHSSQPFDRRGESTKKPPQSTLQWLSGSLVFHRRRRRWLSSVESAAERIYERWRMWIENWL